MTSLGEAPAPAGGCRHSALIYGSEQEFLDVAMPFVEQGAAASEPTLVAVQARNIENLRAALGGEPSCVTLLAVEDWYETSAGTRDKVARWAGERVNGHRVRIIGEPPWAVGNDAQVRDWARHESVINVAFAGIPVSFICPYDSRVLPNEIVEHAHSTHPEIAGPDAWTESHGYEDPLDFCRRLDSRVAGPTGDPAAEIAFGLADLARLRRLVTSIAIRSGLPDSRAGELALAVNEVAANAVVHGRPPATLRAWQMDGEIVCEVSDSGDGIEDALAGQLAPPADGLGGRGLWMARLLCDAVEIRKGVGCTVALHAAVPSFTLAA